jgi:hypothetical protein
MPKSGHLVLTKVVLSTIPTYKIMATQLPGWAIDEIDRIRRKFFWEGVDVSVRGKGMVAGPRYACQRPRVAWGSLISGWQAVP